METKMVSQINVDTAAINSCSNVDVVYRYAVFWKVFASNLMRRRHFDAEICMRLKL